jgi:hypothetical protein
MVGLPNFGNTNFNGLTMKSSSYNLLVSDGLNSDFFPIEMGELEMSLCSANFLDFAGVYGIVMKSAFSNWIEFPYSGSVNAMDYTNNAIRFIFSGMLSNTFNKFNNNTIISGTGSSFGPNEFLNVQGSAFGKTLQTFQNNKIFSVTSIDFSAATGTYVYNKSYATQVMGVTGATGAYAFYIDNSGNLTTDAAIN